MEHARRRVPDAHVRELLQRNIILWSRDRRGLCNIRAEMRRAVHRPARTSPVRVSPHAWEPADRLLITADVPAIRGSPNRPQQSPRQEPVGSHTGPVIVPGRDVRRRGSLARAVRRAVPPGSLRTHILRRPRRRLHTDCVHRGVLERAERPASARLGRHEAGRRSVRARRDQRSTWEQQPAQPPTGGEKLSSAVGTTGCRRGPRHEQRECVSVGAFRGVTSSRQDDDPRGMCVRGSAPEEVRLRKCVRTSRSRNAAAATQPTHPERNIIYLIGH